MTTEVLIKHNNPNYSSKLRVTILSAGASLDQLEEAHGNGIIVDQGKEDIFWVHSHQFLLIEEILQ